MIHFFNTIEEFKRLSVGDAVDNDEAFLVAIRQMIELAETKYLAPWIGEKTLKTLRDAYPDAALNSPAAALTGLIQKALGWFALYEHSFVSGIRRDSGGTRMVNDTPYKYLVADDREKCLEIGYEALEIILNYLDGHLSDFTDWRDGLERVRHKAVFLNTAAAFRLAYAAHITRHTFDLLRGVIEDVEMQTIEHLLPIRFVTYLRGKYFASMDNTTAEEKQVVFLIQKLIAAQTLQEAMHRHFVELSQGRVTQVSHHNDQHRHTQRPPSRTDMERAAFHTEGWASAHAKRLRAYIEQQGATKFPLCFSTDLTGGTNPDADAWGRKTAAETNNATARHGAVPSRMAIL